MKLKTCTTLDELINALTIAKEHCVPGNSKVSININAKPDDLTVLIDVQFDNNNIELAIY